MLPLVTLRHANVLARLSLDKHLHRTYLISLYILTASHETMNFIASGRDLKSSLITTATAAALPPIDSYFKHGVGYTIFEQVYRFVY